MLDRRMLVFLRHVTSLSLQSTEHDNQHAECYGGYVQVTYNTLIDVYGKLGQWEQALQVLRRMKFQVGPCTFILQTLFRMSLLTCSA